MPVDERVARSVALEQAYVHDVYEQFLDNHTGKPWPKVQQFIEDLEPGSIICDVGKFPLLLWSFSLLYKVSYAFIN